MAVIPVYTTAVAGTVLAASYLNSQVRDAGNFFLAKPYCNIFNSAGVTVGATTLVLVPWDTELEDNDNMHSTSTNPSRVIFQTTGVVLLSVGTAWVSASASNKRILLRLNSGGSSAGGTPLHAVDAPSPTSIGANTPTMSWCYRAVNVGDYVETFVESSVAINTSTVVSPPSTFYQSLWEIA
jgi:hypothetical protein